MGLHKPSPSSRCGRCGSCRQEDQHWRRRHNNNNNNAVAAAFLFPTIAPCTRMVAVCCESIRITVVLLYLGQFELVARRTHLQCLGARLFRRDESVCLGRTVATPVHDVFGSCHGGDGSHAVSTNSSRAGRRHGQSTQVDSPTTSTGTLNEQQKRKFSLYPASSGFSMWNARNKLSTE